MSGTVLITAANGSLAIPAVHYLLSTYANYHALLTVRDDSDADGNTRRLRAVLSCFPPGRASIWQLDHYYWNLVDEVELTTDGFDKTFQVSHLAHVALILDLLPSFRPHEGGRIILLSSDAHWPGKNALAKIDPGIPEDLDRLVKPPVAPEPLNDNFALGFQRYANAKLVMLMWMYALNRFLQKVRHIPDCRRSVAYSLTFCRKRKCRMSPR